tara:strand:+ start:11 stop:436 length:426 start_codon:yes stop_codon:yes gene_type:complete
MNLREVKDAVISQQKMLWNDPDPIDGNDYRVQKIWNIDERTAMIQYGSLEDNYLSEAQVYISELVLSKQADEMMPPFFYQGTIITDHTLEESGRMPVANGYYKEELKEAIPQKQADEILTIRGDASLWDFECITNKNQSDE